MKMAAITVSILTRRSKSLPPISGPLNRIWSKSAKSRIKARLFVANLNRENRWLEWGCVFCSSWDPDILVNHLLPPED
jgi:hypothetical protein